MDPRYPHAVRGIGLTVLYPGLVSCVVIPAVFPGSAFELPTLPLHLGMLGAIGVLGAVGHFLLMKAHHDAPARSSRRSPTPSSW